MCFFCGLIFKGTKETKALVQFIANTIVTESFLADLYLLLKIAVIWRNYNHS